MSIHFKPGHEDAIMLARLRGLANGHDRDGNPVDQETQLAAIQQYQDIMAKKAELGIAKDRQVADALLTGAQADAERRRSETYAEVERRRVAVEENRLKLDALQAAERLKLDTYVATERLRIEERLGGERLQIEKAEVMVKALQVAATAGVDPERLLEAVMGFGDKLLPGPTDRLQLEDKQKK